MTNDLVYTEGGEAAKKKRCKDIRRKVSCGESGSLTS